MPGRACGARGSDFGERNARGARKAAAERERGNRGCHPPRTAARVDCPADGVRAPAAGRRRRFFGDTAVSVRAAALCQGNGILLARIVTGRRARPGVAGRIESWPGPTCDADMDSTLISGFVALAALMIGLFRDVKRDAGKRYDNLRSEMLEGYAQTGKRIDDLRSEMLEGHARLDQRIDDLRTEMREGCARLDWLIDRTHAQTAKRIDDTHAQTAKRIDDLRVTVAALIPRAAAEPAAKR